LAQRELQRDVPVRVGQQRLRLAVHQLVPSPLSRHESIGHSSTNLGSLYKGLAKDTFVNFKHLRKTRHSHHPVDDAKGNAEALLAMKEMGLKISFE
jgi:hypothetical protein